MSARISRLQFMDGAAGDGEVRLFLAADLQSGNFDVTRLCVWRGAQSWFYWDFRSVAVSVCMTVGQGSAGRAYYALGRDGKIWVAEAGVGDHIEVIEEAGTGRSKLGYLNRIRKVGDSILACGDQGQVYRRTDAGWEHMDDGLLHRERRKQDVSINDIGGTDLGNVYAVGDDGRAFHFDGKRWSDVSPSTNVFLSSLRCEPTGAVYICGDEGTLLRGDRNGWSSVIEPDPELGCIWDVEVFGDVIYCAVEDQVMAVQRGELVAVEFDLDVQPDAHRLSKRDGILWSIGENNLCTYDGERWTHIVHPDNAQ